MRRGLSFDIGDERRRILATSGLIFAGNKILVVLVSAIALWDKFEGLSFFGVLRLIFVDNFYHWDAYHYTTIAQQGYDAVKETAFFPGYPAAMRAVSWLLHISPLAAGVLISNVLFFLAVYFFIRLALVDYDWSSARRAALLLAFYPTAFYFSAPYTESMFMLVGVLALLAMRRQRWQRAGLWGAIAAVTRNTGVFLGIPYLIEFFTEWRLRKATPDGGGTAPDHSYSSAAPGKGRLRIWSVAWVVPIGVGVVAYAVYLWVAKGDPLAFIHQQKAYGRGSDTPWVTLIRGYEYGLRILVHPSKTWWYVYYVTQLFFPALVIVVLITSFRKIRWSYWVLILYSLVFPLLAPANAEPGLNTTVVDYFASFSRYSLMIVPLYFGIERLLKGRWVFGTYVVVSALFLAVFLYAWSHHMWVA
jgi:hypothetical protein